MKPPDTDCSSCQSHVGYNRLSPGPIIFESPHWVVDHFWPVKLPGWLVLSTKEHVPALQDLSPEAWADFGIVAKQAVAALRVSQRAEKVYVAFFAEAPDCHLHAHVIPRAADQELRGPKIFQLTLHQGDEAEAIPKQEVIDLSRHLRSFFRGKL